LPIHQHSDNPIPSSVHFPAPTSNTSHSFNDPNNTSAANRRVQSTINTFQHRRNIERSSDSQNGIPWGHYPETNKTGCRIIFQNVNGIPHSNNYAKAHAIGMELDAIQADIIGLAETNLDWSTDRNILLFQMPYKQILPTRRSSINNSIHLDLSLNNNKRPIWTGTMDRN
jgi:hypothetical protein